MRHHFGVVYRLTSIASQVAFAELKHKVVGCLRYCMSVKVDQDRDYFVVGSVHSRCVGRPMDAALRICLVCVSA